MATQRRGTMMDGNWGGWVLCVVLGAIAVAYARAYYLLRARYIELDTALAGELRRNRVLEDRAETAEAKLAFDEKQIDALLLVPQTMCHDGALRRPTVAVIQEQSR